MKRYEGGTAIMLRIPEDSCRELIIPAQTWGTGLDTCKLVEPRDYHLTLQFIGRDLPPDTIASVVVAAFISADELPRPTLQFTGVFGIHRTQKGCYLTAQIRKANPLTDARERVRRWLLEMQVKPKDSFGFNPHVTLVEAPPSGVRIPAVPDPIKPFSVECRELVVKYGKHQMTVEL